MSALVIYESMYGNTRAIAEAVAAGIGSVTRVDLVEVSAAPSRPGDDVDLLVIGGPTHAHGMSRPQTRASAAKEGPIVSRGVGVREWLERQDRPSHPMVVATFDTRYAKARWITGSAAHSGAKALRRKGYTGEIPSQSFFVDHTLGPLRDGEVLRAREWGAALATQKRVVRI